MTLSTTQGAQAELRPHSNSTYFADLDGLRAVAVLAVVAHHAGLPGVSGGFTGVDIFFVLSGFFITLQLARDLDAGQFSLKTFYERRVRRILPALYVVLAVTSLFAVIIMIPEDLNNFSGSLIASVFFVANAFFWQDISYFAQDASTRPLLHLWSLAVEEQFYIFFPVALAMAVRFGRRTALLSVVAGILVSFLASVMLTPASPAASFFLLPTRTWELLLGALVALSPRIPLQQVVRDVLSVAGLVMLAAALALIDSSDNFPGWIAILPAGGSTLLIWASVAGGGVGNRLLKAKVLVGIGLISYSLYLWHWPVLTFAQYVHSGGLSAPLAFACVAASFLMATLSWRFVERPFRGSRSRISFRTTVIMACAGAAAFIALAYASIRSDGLPGRLSPSAAQYISREAPEDFATCFDLAPEIAAGRAACHLGRVNASTKIVLWGDSHAYRLGVNAEWLAREQDLDILLLTRGSCPPLLGVRFGRDPKPCSKFNSQALTQILSIRPQYVIISARWTGYAKGLEPASPNAFNALSAGAGRSTSTEDNQKVFRDALIATVNLLQSRGIRVLLVGPVPGLTENAPRALAMAEQWQTKRPVGPLRKAVDAHEETVLSALAPLDRLPGVAVFYPHAILCDPEQCAISTDARSLYMDDNHLNNEGARKIHPAFTASFNALRSSRPGLEQSATTDQSPPIELP